MTDTTTVTILLVMRELLARPGGWTQGFSARDETGEPCDPRDCAAVAFCPIGAWLRLGFSNAIDAFRRAIGDSLIIDWNDAPGRTQAEVLAVIDRAIEAERVAQ